MILYYGTDDTEAIKICKDQYFSSKRFYGLEHDAENKGKVFLSYCYAPLYAYDKIMMSRGKDKKAALIKCSVEDDKIQLDEIGNAKVEAKDIEVLGVIIFNAIGSMFYSNSSLICPLNFKMMGAYFRYVTEWLYQGDYLHDCLSFFDYEMKMSQMKKEKIHFNTDMLYEIEIIKP